MLCMSSISPSMITPTFSHVFGIRANGLGTVEIISSRFRDNFSKSSFASA